MRHSLRTWMCIHLAVWGPLALPLAAARNNGGFSGDRPLPRTGLSVAIEPFLVPFGQLRQQLGIEWSPTSGEPLQVGNLSFAPGALYMTTDRLRSQESTIEVVTENGVAQLGTTYARVTRSGIFVELALNEGGVLSLNTFRDPADLHIYLDGTYTTDSEVVPVFARLNHDGSIEFLSDREALNTSIAPALAGVQIGDASTLAVLAAVAIMLLFVAVVIIICTIGAWLRWFGCELSPRREDRFSPTGDLPWHRSFRAMSA